MSFQLFPEDVLFEQRLLSCGGFYNAKLDGQYGPKTQSAEAAAQASYARITGELGAFDPRSEKAILTLLPDMQRKARMILKAALDSEKTTGIHCVLLSGTRTYAEQNRLYKLVPKVTNAHGGQSNHNFGIAVDVGLFQNGKYLTGANAAENKIYADFATLIKRQVHDIEWGGDWVTFKDMPHYQHVTGKTLTEIRGLFEQGASFI